MDGRQCHRWFDMVIEEIELTFKKTEETIKKKKKEIKEFCEEFMEEFHNQPCHNSSMSDSDERFSGDVTETEEYGVNVKNENLRYEASESDTESEDDDSNGNCWDESVRTMLEEDEEYIEDNMFRNERDLIFMNRNDNKRFNRFTGVHPSDEDVDDERLDEEVSWNEDKGLLEIYERMCYFVDEMEEEASIVRSPLEMYEEEDTLTEEEDEDTWTGEEDEDEDEDTWTEEASTVRSPLDICEEEEDTLTEEEDEDTWTEQEGEDQDTWTKEEEEDIWTEVEGFGFVREGDDWESEWAFL